MAKSATWILLTLSLLAVWALFYSLVLSGLQEAHAQHNAYTTFRQQLAAQTEAPPLGGVIPFGAPVALLDAPSLDLRDTVVIEGTASQDLEAGPGHWRQTPLPGQPGVSVIFGRATLFGGPFGDITRARAGSSIVVTTGQGRFRYTVEDVRHIGDPVPKLPSGGSQLTLATAEGGSAGNLWTPRRPVYVDAILSGKTQPSPGGGVSTVPASEQVMAGDTENLFELVLWLALLCLVGAAVAWATVRWGRWKTWLVGAPAILAVLWATTAVAVQLLPNLM